MTLLATVGRIGYDDRSLPSRDQVIVPRRGTANSDLSLILRRLRAPWWIALIVVLTLLAIQLLIPGAGPLRGGPGVDPTDVERTYRVERVIDGDTLMLEGGERVRLIGVDTPETAAPAEPFATEAARFMTRLVEGRRVRLGFDKERRDRYGRLLAYVYSNGVFINEAILRAGYGTTLSQYPYSNAMKRVFQEAEADAQAAGRGLWSPLPPHRKVPTRPFPASADP